MKNFQLFVAEHTRRILAHLQNPALTEEEQRASLVMEPPAVSMLSQTHELDVSAAEIVAGDNYVFPTPEGAGRVGWCIMLRSDLTASPNTVLFELMGRLSADLDTHAFLSASYHAFFDREIDPIGLANYVQMLEAGQITRRDLFNILLNSQEGRERAQRYLLVPEPSSWLAAFNVAGNASAAFPRFIVKK
jgi:hypothetical protein